MNVAWFHMGIVGLIVLIAHEVFWHHGWVGLGWVQHSASSSGIMRSA
jgi:hypothetical protein